MGQLQPATPAIGVVTVGQVLMCCHSVQNGHRFGACLLQTEDQDMVEFAFAEPEVHIRPATILSKQNTAMTTSLRSPALMADYFSRGLKESRQKSSVFSKVGQI